MRSPYKLALLACMAFSCPLSWADDPSDGAFKISGSISLIGGQVVDGYLPPAIAGINSAGVNCPCYIADWANAGVYNDKFSIRPDSRAGMQGQYFISDKASLVAGVEAHSANSQVDVSAFYLKYALTDELELQVGRTRIPLYSYSNLQDVGAMLPWIAPPPELYGWSATYYNGASLRYATEAKGYAIETSIIDLTQNTTGNATVVRIGFDKMFF